MISISMIINNNFKFFNVIWPQIIYFSVVTVSGTQLALSCFQNCFVWVVLGGWEGIQLSCSFLCTSSKQQAAAIPDVLYQSHVGVV